MTQLAELHVCHAERNGIWHVPLGATLLCLDDCSCGELDELLCVGLIGFCFTVCDFWVAMHSCNGKLLMPLQAVYADAYVATAGNLGPAKSGIAVSELNQFNLLTSLASQKLVLSQTTAGKAEQRVQ